MRMYTLVEFSWGSFSFVFRARSSQVSVAGWGVLKLTVLQRQRTLRFRICVFEMERFAISFRDFPAIKFCGTCGTNAMFNLRFKNTATCDTIFGMSAAWTWFLPRTAQCQPWMKIDGAQAASEWLRSPRDRQKNRANPPLRLNFKNQR